MNHMLFFSLVLAFLIGGVANAETKVKFVTFPIPLMVESPEKGKFIDLAKEVAKRANVYFEISVMPPKRATEMFSKNEVDVLFPGLEVTLPVEYERTGSAYQKVDYAFYKKGKPFKSLKDIEGKTVGITRGYPYVKELTSNAKIKIEEADSDVINFKKLEAGRIDAFIVEEVTGQKALSESGAKEIEYDKQTPISSQDVFFAVKKGNKQLASDLSKSLESLIKDGTLGNILK